MTPGTKEKLRVALPPIVALVLFAAALEVLRNELHAVTWHQLVADIVNTPRRQLFAAIFLTAASYAVLTGYDFIAFAYLGRHPRRAQVALTSFLAYAIANNVGFAMLSGTSIRYRFYSRWGFTAEDLSRLVFSYGVTFWLGLLLLGGISLATNPLPSILAPSLQGGMVLAGWLIAAVSLAYVAVACVRRAPLNFRGFELPAPPPSIALAQLTISVIDWSLAAAVLYVLLPARDVPFLTFVGVFGAAQLLGLISHVPGGIGILDSVLILLMKPYVDPGMLLPSLLAYRAIYYLAPLAIAAAILVIDEVHQRRAHVVRIGALLGRATEQLAPRVLSVVTFISGLVLLFSGATPAAEGRLALLDRFLPLGVIEASHFIGSVVGAALLLLSQSLARRLDAAYVLTTGAVALGVMASLLKGADYEEAALLMVVLVALGRARPAFDRRAALFETRFGPAWIVAVVGAMVASIWLGVFAFKHVSYSSDLWWQFELQGEASRALRASVGSGIFLLLFAVGRLLAPAPHEAEPPTDADLDAAAGIIARQTSTFPSLVYLRDKALLFTEARDAFVMYAVQGRTWVALGDPVGPAARVGDLVRMFLETCDDFGGVPVFYEVSKQHLHWYADFGLTFLKLGEDASVDLRTFSLHGGESRRFRQALRYLERDGATFRVVAPPEVPAVIDELRDVSDDWLAHKAGREKGFSLGFFDPAYLARFPVAVIEQGGRIVAFANLWPGASGQELSIDLMRYRHDAPNSAMDALFVHLIVWGKTAGYETFHLGMAPLSGFERSPVAPLWIRLGAFLYRHGEGLYNFQGLRAYKEKFHPEWQPRYLVYPGGLRLPRILADVATLVSGGYRRAARGHVRDRGRAGTPAYT